MHGQTDQAVSVHLGPRELASIVASVQGHHRTGCLNGLELTCGAELLDRHRGGRASLSIAPGHVQWQHPAAV